MNFRKESSGPELSHTSFVRRLTAGALLINLFIVVMIAVSLRQSYVQYREHAQSSTQNLAKLLDEEIGSDLGKIDMVLLGAADEVTRQLANGGINPRLLNNYLHRQLERMPEAISLRVTDARGWVKYGPGVEGPAVNVADREYFLRQRDARESQLVIARPLFARISKQWSIPVSRRINRADGSFAGVVYVNASLAHLYATFANLELGAHGSVALCNPELETFARYPELDGVASIIGKKINSPSLQMLMQSGRESATYRAESVVDGVVRTFSYRKLSDYPLYVVVGRAEQDYLAGWRREVVKMSLLGVAFSLVTLWLTWLSKRAWVRQHQVTQSLRNSEAQIKFMATHDALTGLPNRLLAGDRFELAASFADRGEFRLAFICLDLDNFKTINDSLGHSVGDATLKVVARRLLECVRDMDTVSRQGGDEFLLLLSDLGDLDAVSIVVEKILRCLAAPFQVGDVELSTSISMGVAMYPEDGSDFETLLKKADAAMYQAKAAGRNTYRFFAEQMNTDVDDHLRLRHGLRQALERDELMLHYQPQIHLASGKVVGAEALLRWNHPEMGMIPPGRFIPVAEDCGLIAQIGDWVLLEACRQAAAWRQAGLPELVMAVNVSSVQFKHHGLENSVIQALVDSGLAPGNLELELTESVLIQQDGEMVLKAIQRLKSLGLQLSIDDFGTGYSSLSYLKRFAVDKLKIDRSFVRDMADDPNDAAIVQAIIQMARTLNLKTIAEGVEDEHQLAILGMQKCDEAQGFYFARPLPAREFEQFLRMRME